MNNIRQQLEQLWHAENFDEANIQAIHDILKEKPSYVDYFVEMLNPDSSNQPPDDSPALDSLYLVILPVIPLESCVRYALDKDDWTIEDFRSFHWFEGSDTFQPMSAIDYIGWLERQIYTDGIHTMQSVAQYLAYFQNTLNFNLQCAKKYLPDLYFTDIQFYFPHLDERIFYPLDSDDTLLPIQSIVDKNRLTMHHFMQENQIASQVRISPLGLKADLLIIEITPDDYRDQQDIRRLDHVFLPRGPSIIATDEHGQHTYELDKIRFAYSDAEMTYDRLEPDWNNEQARLKLTCRLPRPLSSGCKVTENFLKDYLQFLQQEQQPDIITHLFHCINYLDISNPIEIIQPYLYHDNAQLRDSAFSALGSCKQAHACKEILINALQAERDEQQHFLLLRSLHYAYRDDKEFIKQAILDNITTSTEERFFRRRGVI